MRGVLVRALEWRARRLSDPPDRLQFLQRNVMEAVRQHECQRGTEECVRHIWRTRRYVVFARDDSDAIQNKPLQREPEGLLEYVTRRGQSQPKLLRRSMAPAGQNLPLERYRKNLRKRYRDAIRALRGKGAYQEYN